MFQKLREREECTRTGTSEYEEQEGLHEQENNIP